MIITVTMKKKVTAMKKGMMKAMAMITVMTIPKKAIAMTNMAMTAMKKKTATMTTVMAASLMVMNMKKAKPKSRRTRPKKAGISIEKAAPVMMGKVIPLTGRITINQNAKAEVRARFPGIIRSVKANLGEQVKKGQVLAVVESNESLKDYNVTAPIDGTILARNTNLGDVANGEPLFTIADLSTVWAKFHIFPKDADMVAAQQSVRVHTLDEGKEQDATISMLFPTADALSQTLVAVVPMDNKNSMWRPGTTIEGDVTVSQKQVSLAVRESSLQSMENQTVVFVKMGDSYEMKPVKTGVSDGRYIEITSGLSAGQSYVSEGSFVIKADILKSGAAHEH
jgi:cobalt-zinc-cadmium efflux system membrane fusion protein